MALAWAKERRALVGELPGTDGNRQGAVKVLALPSDRYRGNHQHAPDGTNRRANRRR